MEQVLQIQIQTDTGKKVTLAIKDVKDDVDGAQVKALFEALKPIWATSGKPETLLSAKLVNVTSTDFMA